MKVTSQILYKTLRDVLSIELKSAGFIRTKSGMLGWTRREGDQHLTFWFQCDRWGWDDSFGSRFTLEFQFSPSVGVAEGDVRRRERFSALLTPEEREIVRHINNTIKSSLPEPAPNHPIWLLREDLQQSIKAAYSPDCHSYGENDDVWLHYFTVRDIETWGVFLKEKIVRMCESFVQRHRE